MAGRLQAFFGHVHYVVVGNVPAAETNRSAQHHRRGYLAEQRAAQVVVHRGHGIAVQHNHRFNVLQSVDEVFSREGAERMDLHQPHRFALLPQPVNGEPGRGSQGTHGNHRYLGILDVVSLDQAAVTPAYFVHVLFVGLPDDVLGGDVQRVVQLVPPLHVLPVHVNVAVAAHPGPGIILGEVQVLYEVQFRRQHQRGQDAVHRFLGWQLNGIAVVGHFPTVIGNESRQQHVGMFADPVGLDNGVQNVLRVLAVVVNPVDVPVHNGVLIVGPHHRRGFQCPVRHHHNDGDPGVRSENQLLGCYQQTLGVGRKRSAGARLGGGDLGVHHAALVLHLDQLGVERSPLDVPGNLFAHLVGGADGEVAQRLYPGQHQGAGRSLVAG